MPYSRGSRLPGERASKIGHLEVIKNPLVRNLMAESVELTTDGASSTAVWHPVPESKTTLPLVFGIDGSCQVITRETPPFNSRAFVKTALLRLDGHALSQVDRNTPHPLSLRDVLQDSAMYHATVIPLRHVRIGKLSQYDAVRYVIYHSLKDDAELSNHPFETLKWLIYQKWHKSENRDTPQFECPHCASQEAFLEFDADIGRCHKCNGELYLTDMLGFHQIMGDDSAPNAVALDYMMIHENLMLFTGVKYFWESNRATLAKCLFIKDGPLSIRAQYSKLVAPIRRFLKFAMDEGTTVHILGQEKSGAFFDHLQLIGYAVKEGMYFIPGDAYIKSEIQSRPPGGAPYGKDTNYGAKMFLKLSNYHQMVLNIPTGSFSMNPSLSELIGFSDIIGTLPSILSNRYEGALIPIELANGIASLSTYPSARILKVFSESSAS